LYEEVELEDIGVAGELELGAWEGLEAEAA